MSLPTQTLSFSHKWFYQCVNHKKKLSLFILLPVFDSFSFFKASLWLLVDKVLQKIQNLIKVRLDFYFNVASWFPANVRVKPHFKTHCPPPPSYKEWNNIWMVPQENFIWHWGCGWLPRQRQKCLPQDWSSLWWWIN